MHACTVMRGGKLKLKIVSLEEIKKIYRERIELREQMGFLGIDKDLEYIERLHSELRRLGWIAFIYTPKERNGEKWLVEESTAYLHKVPEILCEYILNHETHHIALRRIGEDTLFDKRGNLKKAGLDELISFFTKRYQLIEQIALRGKPFPCSRTDKIIIELVHDNMKEYPHAKEYFLFLL